jgi:hypothetical protein
MESRDVPVLLQTYSEKYGARTLITVVFSVYGTVMVYVTRDFQIPLLHRYNCRLIVN